MLQGIHDEFQSQTRSFLRDHHLCILVKLVNFTEWLFRLHRPKRKRGWKINSQGYPMIYVPNHPRRWKDGYVGEAIYLWERYHNACLLEWSRVYHKDCNKFNNRKRNLIAKRGRTFLYD